MQRLQSGFFSLLEMFLTQPKKQKVFSIGQVFQILRTKAVIIYAFPCYIFCRLFGTFIPADIRELFEALQTVLHQRKWKQRPNRWFLYNLCHDLANDAEKFCLTNKECFLQADKTAVNPSKICCWSTIAIVWNRHPQKKLIIRFRHVVKVFRLKSNIMGSNACLLLHAGLETSLMPTL